MSKKWYVGVNSVAREVKHPYIGVNNVARKVKNGYVGVSGVARQFFFSGYTWKKYKVGYDYNTTKTDYKFTSSFEGREHINVWPILPESEDKTSLQARDYYESDSEPSFNSSRKQYSVESNGWSSFPNSLNGKILAHHSFVVRDASYTTHFKVTSVSKVDDGRQRLLPYLEKSDDDWFLIYNVDGKTLRLLKTHRTATKGSYVSDVTSDNLNAYPTNGIHTDGYWYVKQ